MEMLVFLGKLLGCAARTKNYLDLCISPIIWKLIVRQSVDLEDLRGIDLTGVNQLMDLRHRSGSVAGLSPEAFDLAFCDLTFSTISRGGSVVELHPGGQMEQVRYADIDRYCDELEQYWLGELALVSEAVRAGLETQLPAALLSLLRWNELEEHVCGSPVVDVDLLESVCTYERDCSVGDPHVVWFWQLMRNEFTQEDLRAFLRFAWGRTRLPLNKAGFSQPFKIQGFPRHAGGVDNYLPVSHTCFFSVELPRYSTKEILRQKLLYAVHNCVAIDGDDTGAGMRAAALGMET
jgi:hypothetical protein